MRRAKNKTQFELERFARTVVETQGVRTLIEGGLGFGSSAIVENELHFDDKR